MIHNYKARIPIAVAIIEEDGRIILQRRNFFPWGKFDIPGGHVKKGELVEKAAIREAKEESGFEVKIIKKLGVYDYFHRKDKRMHVFIAKVVSGKLRNSIEGSPRWFKFADIPFDKLAVPEVHARVLKNYLKFRRSNLGKNSK